MAVRSSSQQGSDRQEKQIDIEVPEMSPEQLEADRKIKRYFRSMDWKEELKRHGISVSEFDYFIGS